MPLNHSSKFSELTDEHFKLIGKITVEWSNIELLLRVLLARLLFTPEFLARTYTDHITAAKLQEAIIEASNIHRCRYQYKIISEATIQTILQINEQISQLRSSRNKFAHFCWMRSNDNEVFGTNFSGGIPNGKKHKKSFISYTVAELEDFYRKAYAVVDELLKIKDNLPEAEEALFN